MRILVVEDNPWNLRLVTDLLKRRGHETLVAVDVATAAEQIERETFDVALVDIRIPGGGGEAVLKLLRAHPVARTTPAIAVTAQAMRGDREHLLSLGFDGYIPKPINVRTFMEQVQEVIGARGEPL